MVSIDDAAKKIVASYGSVVFLDTCVLLDVIRAPIRETLPIGTVEAASRLALALSQPQGNVGVVVGSLVGQEWHDHFKSVNDEVSRFIEHIDDCIGRIDFSLGRLGVTVGAPAFVPHQLADRLADLSQLILNQSIQLDDSPEIRLKAIDRLYAGRPPARKDGQLKDCQILEECLAVAVQIRAAGFPGPVVYCTSNTRDYGEPNRLDGGFAAELQSIAVTYTTNLPWAVTALGI